MVDEVCSFIVRLPYQQCFLNPPIAILLNQEADAAGAIRVTAAKPGERPSFPLCRLFLLYNRAALSTGWIASNRYSANHRSYNHIFVPFDWR
jgi:hypothetical protein